MTKTKPKLETGHLPQPQRSALRKNNVWTRDKITRLISLYRQHECLWNNYIEAYKNKDRRNVAIQDICTTLRITKFDFGKKIHNLRNQFNAEMKKLERRIEESGGGDTSTALDGGGHFRSRWDHYESLMFLRDVIAPRPGYQSNGGGNYQQQTRKIELKYQQASDEEDDEDAHIIISRVDNMDSGNAAATLTTTTMDVMEEEETEYQYEEANAEEEAEMIDQADELRNYEATVAAAARVDEVVDQKYIPPSSMREVIITTLPAQNNNKTTYFTAHHSTPPPVKKITRMQQQQIKPSVTTTQHQLPPLQHQDSCQDHNDIATTPSKHLPSCNNVKFTGQPSTVEQATVPSTLLKQQPERITETTTRDQWDTFGEMVATEFRNLNSDLSRKKLKRKFMQAMLEVGEEDDGININIAIN